MTILSAPASAASTSSLLSSEEHPLKEQRRRLQETQNKIIEIDRIKTQLQQLLQPDKGRGYARRSSTTSEASSWSIASTSSMGSESLASDIKGRELLVPLSSIAYVPGTISKREIDEEDDDGDSTPIVYMRKNDGTGSKEAEGLILLDDVTNGKEKENYEEMTIPAAIAALDAQKLVLGANLTKLRDEVVSAARATLIEHLGGQTESSDDSVAPVNEQGQALNEEGLPFVDPVEPLAEGQERTGVSALAPHVREDISKEERRRWMDSLLSKLESEEKGETKAETKEVDATPPRQRPEIHRRMSSAERPAPQKSVLKATGPAPLPLPKFGSSGFRRGFLNLNPSSPAAEQSSDPVEAIDYSQPSKSEMTRANSSMDDGLSKYASSSDVDDRMSRSMELPSKKESQQKRKKTVRILSPEREVDTQQMVSDTKSQKLKSVRDADDDGQDEAASILQLLGLDAIKDHPTAAGLYEALKDSEKMEQLAKKAEAARKVALEKEKETVLNSKPAVGQTVLERPSKEAKVTTSQSSRGVSAFAKGFLNKPPTKASSSAVPAGPGISQGISALERAGQSDADLERERVEKGLKPAVPHARPSKAFAEKMEAKRRGESVVKETEDEKPVRMSKVRFGDMEEAGQDSAEDELVEEEGGDTSLDSIGIHISEEQLDEDTVEALGYFSDEDYDPDVGLDEEEILSSKPKFSADALQINNEELRSEYERIKASLGSSSHVNGGDADDSGNDDEDFAEGRDLTLNNGDEKTSRVSRFKQDRAKRVLNGQSAVSNELGTGLEKAQNIGPSMLIPSIANIRYPIQDQEAVEGQEVQLQGKDDEEDDDLEELMRQRLIQREQTKVNGSEKKPSEAPAPPQVISAKGAVLGEAEQATPTPPVKKPSLFKSRMSQK